eukprot:2761226-Pleurochrysis_carterae.AAC.1
MASCSASWLLLASPSCWRTPTAFRCWAQTSRIFTLARPPSRWHNAGWTPCALSLASPVFWRANRPPARAWPSPPSRWLCHTSTSCAP